MNPPTIASDTLQERDAIVSWIRARIAGLKVRNDAKVAELPAHERESADLIYAMGRQSMALIADAIERGAHHG